MKGGDRRVAVDPSHRKSCIHSSYVLAFHTNRITWDELLHEVDHIPAPPRLSCDDIFGNKSFPWYVCVRALCIYKQPPRPTHFSLFWVSIQFCSLFPSFVPCCLLCSFPFPLHSPPPSFLHHSWILYIFLTFCALICIYIHNILILSFTNETV